MHQQFLSINEEDQSLLEKEVVRVKKNIQELIKKSPTMTVQQYQNFSEENEKVIDEIMSKYYFYSTNFQSPENIQKLNNMSNYLTQEFQPLNFDQNYFNLIKKLIVEDEEDQTYKDKKIQSFLDNGIGLSEKDQNKLSVFSKLLNDKQSSFSQNLLNARKKFKVSITHEMAKDLPEDIRVLFGEDLTLNYSISAISKILENCPNSKIREMVYEENEKIANKNTEFDNSGNVRDIILLKNTIAKIKGFSNAGEKILKDSMANNSGNAYELMNYMSNAIQKSVEQENKQLSDFAEKYDGNADINLSSRSYYVQKLKSSLFDYEFEEEKKFLSLERSLSESFELVKNMYGITFEPIAPVFNIENDGLLYFNAYNNGVHKSVVIIDLFERENKKSGAWVSNYQSSTKEKVGFQVLNTNFKKNEGLTFNQLSTLFHELGHLVHSIVSETKYSVMSGTKGASRDAVEIPSMTMEKFAYEKDVLMKVSDGKLPSDLVKKTNKIRNFMSANFYARQIALSNFDLNVFNSEVKEEELVKNYQNCMFKATGRETSANNNFPMIFSHIFTGSYSSGYYGYLWAEIYAADLFSSLKNSPKVKGEEFKKEVLAHGSTKDPKQLYEKILGRPVNVEKFVEYIGLKSEEREKKSKPVFRR